MTLSFFLVLSIYFAGRLGKEIDSLSIGDFSSSHIVSIYGLIMYVKEKKKRNESLSFNFYASIICVLGIFAPFIYGFIIAK